MTWRDKNLSKPLYMHQLSEGMLRFLWLATLLGSPVLTTLTLLDDPRSVFIPNFLSSLPTLAGSCESHAVGCGYTFGPSRALPEACRSRRDRFCG